MNSSSQKSTGPSWQSTVVAIVVLLMAGGIFVAVFEKEGTDDALQVWAALGTLVGAVVGAIPAYFFGQQGTTAAREEVQRTHDTALNESNRLHGLLERTNETTNNAITTAQEAANEAAVTAASEEARATTALEQAAASEEKVNTLLALAEPALLQKARKQRKDLAW